MRPCTAARPHASLVSLAFAASLGITCLTTTGARAQSDSDRATARQLGQQGQEALDKKDYATAEDDFRRADKMVHAPTLMLGLARALAAEGKYVESQESYNRIVRDGVAPGAPDVFRRALEDAKREVDTVSPKVAGVTITVKASGGVDIAEPTVLLDEHPINSASLGVRRAVDPGSHVLRVSADGFKPAETKFMVAEGGAVDEPVVLEKDLSAPVAAAPAAGTAAPVAATAETSGGPSSSRKILPWVAFGVGGAGLVVGVVGGVLALGKHSTLSDNCKGGCGPNESSDLELVPYGGRHLGRRLHRGGRRGGRGRRAPRDDAEGPADDRLLGDAEHRARLDWRDRHLLKHAGA